MYPAAQALAAARTHLDAPLLHVIGDDYMMEQLAGRPRGAALSWLAVCALLAPS
jgi:hypothetical protein